MKIIDLPGGQGSEAWHQHRAQHWNASDAAAMMGCSSYQTRNELLHLAIRVRQNQLATHHHHVFIDGERLGDC